MKYFYLYFILFFSFSSLWEIGHEACFVIVFCENVVARVKQNFNEEQQTRLNKSKAVTSSYVDFCKDKGNIINNT